MMSRHDLPLGAADIDDGMVISSMDKIFPGNPMHICLFLVTAVLLNPD